MVPGGRVSFVVDEEGGVRLRLPAYRVEDLVGVLKPLSMPVEEQLAVARSEQASDETVLSYDRDFDRLGVRRQEPRS